MPAAARHVELDGIGSGKKRVLRPPGGACHDIFNTSANETTPTRRVKDHMRSSIFSSGSSASSTNGNGSSSLDLSLALDANDNGNASSASSVSGESRNGSLSSGSVSPVTTPGGSKSSSRNPLSWDHGDGANTPSRRNPNQGNPITGDGYNCNAEKPRANTRVPPGGYSSKIW